MADYEGQLQSLRELATRQQSELSNLRTLSEKTLQEKVSAALSAYEGRTSEEERWQKLLGTQEQALANGQRQLHELAQSFQQAQRGGEQQAAEWRQALKQRAGARGGGRAVAGAAEGEHRGEARAPPAGASLVRLVGRVVLIRPLRVGRRGGGAVRLGAHRARADAGGARRAA